MLIRISLVAALLCIFARTSHSLENEIDVRNGKKVLCYYTDWSPYRAGKAKFTPKNINPHICTHILYAFATFSGDGTSIAPADSYQDIDQGGFAEFVALKKMNAKLKALIALGGTGEGAKRFSNAAATPESRLTFIQSIVKFIKTYGFDGINLDWQFPGDVNGRPKEDKQNYVKLVKAMREEFTKETEKSHEEPWVIAVGAPSETEVAENGFDLPELSKYVDFINVVAYDYHRATEAKVHHHAPLYPLKDEANLSNENYGKNIDFTISWYIEHGAPPSQIIFGIPTYGRSFVLAKPEEHSIGSPSVGAGAPGPFTGAQGHLAYYEICSMLQNPGSEWKVEHPNKTAVGPYAVHGNQWVGFDDTDMVKIKGKYACERELGGIMFWTLDFDDFNAECHPMSNPLIRAATEAFKSCGKKRRSTGQYAHMAQRVNKLKSQLPRW